MTSQNRRPAFTEREWQNLETKTAEAIEEVIACEHIGDAASSLGVLAGVLKVNAPPRCRFLGGKVQRLLRPADAKTRGAHLTALTSDQRNELGAALVSLLRFVCHRGAQ